MIFGAEAEWWSVVAEHYGLPILGLIFLAITGNRRLWVFGHQYRSMEALWKERHDAAVERESEWRTMALRGTSIAEKNAGRESTIEERLSALERGL